MRFSEPILGDRFKDIKFSIILTILAIFLGKSVSDWKIVVPMWLIGVAVSQLLLLFIVLSLLAIIHWRRDTTMEHLYRVYRDIFDKVMRYKVNLPGRSALSYAEELISHYKKQHSLKVTFEPLVKILWLLWNLALIVLFLSLMSAFMVNRLDGSCDHVFNGLTNEDHFLDHVYYNMVTLATVGYGDITPNGDSTLHLYSRIFAMLTTFCSILFLIMGGSFFSAFIRSSWEDYHQAIITFLSDDSQNNPPGPAEPDQAIA